MESEKKELEEVAAALEVVVVAVVAGAQVEVAAEEEIPVPQLLSDIYSYLLYYSK